MKTLKTFSLLLLIMGLTLSACKKEDTPDPEPPKPDMSVEFEGGLNSINYPSQNTIDIKVSFKSEKNIARVFYQKPLANGGHVEKDITMKMGPNHKDKALDKNDAVYYFQVSAGALNAIMLNQNSAYYEFTVQDKEGNKESAKFTIKKAEGTYLTTEITTGEIYHNAGQLTGGWDLENDSKLASSAVPATIYMLNTDVAGAPFTGSWKSSTVNGTKFVKLSTGFDYVHATEEAASAEYNAGSPSVSVSNPQVGEMYVAMRSNTYYVIKITYLEPNYSAGTGSNTGQLKFNYKKK